jgi:hypothetical protein
MFKKMGKMGPIVLLILFLLIALYLGSKTSYLTSMHSSSLPQYEGFREGVGANANNINNKSGGKSTVKRKGYW